jgi:hypothetical protein
MDKTLANTLPRHVAGAALAVCFAMGTTGASALHMPAPTIIPDEAVYLTIHLPTGCRAEMTVSDGVLVRASIVDRDCLPAGAKARPVPASLTDFPALREPTVRRLR